MAETPAKLHFLKPSPQAEAEQLTEDHPGAKPCAIFKQERFCQYVLKGISLEKAYEKAGYEGNSSNATRLAGRADVRVRLEWLFEEAARLAVVDAAYVKRRLKNVVDLALDTEIGPDGEVVPARTFSLGAANKALELLGKDFGLFKERIELGGHVQVQNLEVLKRLTPEERDLMRRMITNAAARPAPANQNGDAEDPGNGVVPASQ